MEVVGFTASVAGLIQIAGQVTVFASGYIGKVKRATEEINNLINELTSLSSVLNKLARLDDKSSSNPTELQKLQIPLQECTNKLQDLRLKLENGMKRGGIRRMLRSLKWPLEESETIQFMNYIERRKSLFIVALGIGNFEKSQSIEGQVVAVDRSVKDIQHKIHVISENQNDERISRDKIKRKEVLNWFYPDNFDIKHTDISDRRQKGTGEWLLNSPAMQDWILGSSPSRLLWGYGIPGAGKTFISSGVIDHLTDKADESDGVAYIYFGYKERDDQTPIRVLSSLVKQLGYQVPYLPQNISDLYDELENKAKRPSMEELLIALLSLIASFKRVFMVFDALDECNQNGQRNKFLPLFHRLGENGANIFITSRYYAEDIQASFENIPKIELAASGQDIRSYILQKVEENPRLKRLAEQGKCEESIISKLTENANGMFLLVHFHVEYLCQQTTAKQLFSALESLGTKDSYSGEHPLDPTYNRVLESIRQQPKPLAELARKVLSWIVKAQRALTVEEIQIAVSIDPESRALDELDLPEKATLIEVCASLVTVDEGNTVRLAHLTVQEYLLRSTILMPEIDRDIARVCITYYAFDTFSDGFPSFEIARTEFDAHPLLDYAAGHLAYHLKCSGEVEAVPLILDFLKHRSQAASWLVMSCIRHYSGVYIRSWEFDWGNLGEYFTPLIIATCLGNHLAVQYLLDGGSDVLFLDPWGWSALHWAALKGDLAIIKLMLTYGADISSRDRGGSTPLHRASISGGCDTVKLLLDHGASVSAVDNYGKTPLHGAASEGHEAVVKLLLDHGANVSAVDNYGKTPLHGAASEGHEAVVKLLLDHGANVSAVCKYGKTLLHLAVDRGHEAVAKLLLDHGASVSAVDNYGNTPLHRAASEGHEAVAKLLLDHGASVSAVANYGETPLHGAASEGHEAVVKLLLDHGANVSAVCKYGKTPLHLAVDRGRKAVVKLLLDHGASVSAVCKYGETPLHLAVDRGRKAVAKLLLDHGASVSAVDRYGETLLHGAASEGRKAVVKLLLDHGASVSAVDNDGKTPLHRAADWGHEATAKILLDYGSDISARDADGRTPVDRMPNLRDYVPNQPSITPTEGGAL